ncbi:SMP-30/gluconolactonase/LRE family protein [Afifella sp. IM 167]|uniref:SMP-30/gluconolactonase/LRE family protein n=1 Tax=Afifella sp. IM 167 TaxID=2033586 RepID=UPI001CCE3E9D|nr:SMP-30/gluconolactonase/LRE family protein [Afifella sp. IM 167]MBZ8135163.1 hypothetical protein [Afifella sp. IM 167]
MSCVDVVVERAHILGECPLWDHREGRLLWIDCLGQSVHGLDLDSGEESRLDLETRIGSIGLRRAGGLIAATKQGFAALDPVSGALQLLMPVEAAMPGNRLNDGKCDRAGRYWCGSMNETFAGPTGSLYRLGADLRLERLFGGVVVSNGIAFSPDDARMYFADSRREVVYAFDFDLAAGTISNRRVFIDFAGAGIGRADGATVDAEGNYWCALVFGGAVGCFAPDGRLLEKIALPVTHPTMCAFGGPDLDILFVTSATCLADGPETEPLAGALFAISGTGARGLPEPQFAG